MPSLRPAPSRPLLRPSLWTTSRRLDEHTVKIAMNQSFSPIGHMLHKVKILSQKEVTEQGDNFGKVANKAGTGPYMWDEDNYNPKTSWSAVAFEDYYRGRAKIDKIVWNVIEDDTSAITALQNGDVDWHGRPHLLLGGLQRLLTDKFYLRWEKESIAVATLCINRRVPDRWHDSAE
ncbi:MAG: ABC transporter substrate-binding protein [Intestinimonas sp.]